MGGVDHRPEERDGDRLDARGTEVRGGCADVGLVEGADDAPGAVEPLVHTDAQVAVNELARMLEVDVEALGLETVAEIEDVAESLGAQERGAWAVSLDHRVGGGGGAVHEEICAGEQLVGVEAELVSDRPHTGEDAGAEVARGRLLLPEEQHLSVLGGHREIGERAADIDADAEMIDVGGSVTVRAQVRHQQPVGGSRMYPMHLIV